MERRFPREIGALEGIFAFVREAFAAGGLDEAAAWEVDLILEELFTNVVRHGRGGEPEVEVGLALEDGRVVIEIVDRNVESFDVTAAPAVDVAGGGERRRPGGLGIHLVRSLSESVSYTYENRTSRITVVKRLEEPHV